jgi:hypothetical protein
VHRLEPVSGLYASIGGSRKRTSPWPAASPGTCWSKSNGANAAYYTSALSISPRYSMFVPALCLRTFSCRWSASVIQLQVLAAAGERFEHEAAWPTSDRQPAWLKQL